ncbi:MAG TPA: hypothetical protein VJU59_32265, partial [Paraburkholderia sp.]|uniref:hypothetical protein n=1 Tax=Paraburkholderia sp. TaxID=1926495 RepID=UPI002B484C3B
MFTVLVSGCDATLNRRWCCAGASLAGRWPQWPPRELAHPPRIIGQTGLGNKAGRPGVWMLSILPVGLLLQPS